MELKYVVMTIIKILISVPTILLVSSSDATGLMGGHLDNHNGSSPVLGDYEVYDDQEPTKNDSTPLGAVSEEIPDPSALVVPGYNLPENIFNKGKPFYLERDPLTGNVNFDSKQLSDVDDEEEYDYPADQEQQSSVYDKENIDRRDGGGHHHRPSDVNQLVPNFHDFLNLPVKYNSDKYVYPLISSSYANTKVQGNVNKGFNHKEVRVTTYKPTASPTYYLTTRPPFYNTEWKELAGKSSTTKKTVYTTTTTKKPTTTTKIVNLMDNSMQLDISSTTQKNKVSDIYLTTQNVNNIYLTTKAPTTTTKRALSFFEQLFGDYDEPEPIKTTSTEIAPPEIKDKDYLQKRPEMYPNIHAGPNVATGSNMAHEASYEYDDYENENIQDNIAVESKPVTEVALKLTSSTVSSSKQPEIQTEVYDYIDEKDTTTTPKTTTTISTTTTTTTTTTMKPSVRVTSLPLGENHLSTRPPLLVTSQNIHEQLNNEKVKPFDYNKVAIHQHAPSTSSIHIAHDQDTVSFVMGNHHNIDTGKYVATVVKDNNPLVSYNFKPPSDLKTEIKQTSKVPNFVAGSSVTIQPLRNSEASLAIGVPVNAVKQKPGQVMDEKLEVEDKVEFAKPIVGSKIVFPDDKPQKQQPDYVADLIPPKQPPNREILKLNSKPMYHQLPSDLTPPNELDVPVPNRMERPRPPWDPRPGHFHSGRPEYVRPPRPPPGDVAYKRIDSLPNILPQFRPNVKYRPYEHAYARQPLLERPNNRPVGFFEKLQPPPPPKNLHNLRKLPQLEQRTKLVKPVVEEKKEEKEKVDDQFGYLQTPPKVVLASRRNDQDVPEVETLQMIQAKNAEKKEDKKEVSLTSEVDVKEEQTEKPLYVVYPVNTPPLKMDAIDSEKKETVVIGTRAELPLPPSKITNDFTYDDPLLHPKERNDSPILKPHSKPIFPIKSDFPYPLEKPDPSILHPPVPETPTNNDLSSTWTNHQETKLNSPISATLKTYTEKPIAIAYTPTESKYVIRPETEATVHRHQKPFVNHRTPPEPSSESIAPQEFQAPFQASVNIDSLSTGWSVIRDKAKEVDRMDEETTSVPVATTSEFDIENFKPQLIGGFKPIYSYPEGDVSEREEKHFVA